MIKHLFEPSIQPIADYNRLLTAERGSLWPPPPPPSRCDVSGDVKLLSSDDGGGDVTPPLDAPPGGVLRAAAGSWGRRAIGRATVGAPPFRNSPSRCRYL